MREYIKKLVNRIIEDVVIGDEERYKEVKIRIRPHAFAEYLYCEYIIPLYSILSAPKIKKTVVSQIQKNIMFTGSALHNFLEKKVVDFIDKDVDILAETKFFAKTIAEADVTFTPDVILHKDDFTFILDYKVVDNTTDLSLSDEVDTKYSVQLEVYKSLLFEEYVKELIISDDSKKPIWDKIRSNTRKVLMYLVYIPMRYGDIIVRGSRVSLPVKERIKEILMKYPDVEIEVSHEKCSFCKYKNYCNLYWRLTDKDKMIVNIKEEVEREDLLTIVESLVRNSEKML